MKWKKLFCFLLATVMLFICFPLSIIINAQEINPSLPAEDLNIAPAISGDTTMVLSEGYEARSTAAYEVTGNPEPTVQQDENYEGKIVWNEVSKTLDLAEGLPAGNYSVVLTASNGLETEASLTFILTIEAAPPQIPENFGLSSAILSAGNDTLLQALTYWTQAVTAKPDGYVITDSGNVEISSAEGLAWLISVVNGLNGSSEDDPTFYGKTVTLTNDIDLLAYEWTPIGNNQKPFSGTFEGGGYTIRNIKVDITTSLGGVYAGLFGFINDSGTVRNVSVSGEINASAASSSNYNYSGGISGYSRGEIENCNFSGSVNASNSKNSSGGIVGLNMAYVRNCSNRGEINVANGKSNINRAGGIAGTNHGYVSNSSNSGAVDASGSSQNSAGGIVGYISGNINSVTSESKIINCYNSGSVSSSGTTSNNESGGIAGSLDYGDIENCFNSGAVTATGIEKSTNGAGGIAGQCSEVVNNCYNVGTVIASGYSTNYTGGVIGYNSNDTIKVTNCYWLDTSAAEGFRNEYTGTNCSSFTSAQGKGTEETFDFTIGTEGQQGTLLDALNAWVSNKGSQDYFNWVYKEGSNDGYPTLSIYSAPAFSGPTSMTLAVGYSDVSTAQFELTGRPLPKVTVDSNYGEIAWNEEAKTLDIAAGLEIGSYPVVLTAKNLEGEVSLDFTLTVKDYIYWTEKVKTKPTEGYDDLTDPYNVKISSAEGLAWLISVVNGLNGQKVPVDFSGKTVTLTNDIDLSAYEWTPIGNDLKPFSGIFEGGGQSISGIAVNMTEDDIYGESCAGLFGRIEGATVKNVSVLGDINALAAGQNNYAGGIVGFNESSTVSNCSFSGKVNASGIVTGANYAGGICGHNYSGEKVAALESCNNGGTVTAMNSGGVNFAGGITGNNYGNLANCSNSGSVHSSGSTNLSRNDAGGIAGYNYETGNVVNCFNIGQVSASGDVVDNNAGGVIGNNYGVVANCYNTGAISAIGEDGSNEAGGNSGYNGGSVKNCYNSGNVTASGAGSQNEAGGISGYNQGDLDNCYNIGHVSASVGSESNFDGGIAGYAEDVSSVSNCYWLDTSAAQGIGKNCLYSATNCSSFTEAQGKGTKADFNFKIGTDANAGFGTGTLLDALNAWVTKQGSQDLLTQTLHDYLNWIIIADVNSGYPILRSLCTVTFDANGGTVNPTQISVSRGAPYGELPVPARSGFSFDGWFTSADSGEEITENSIFTTPDSSQILYAHWTALAPPAISGGTSAMRLQAGYTDTSTEPFIISGNPFPSISQNTTHGGKIVWNDKTRFLDIFAGLPAGVYPVVLTAEVISDISISSFTLSGYAATMVAGAMDTEPGNTLTFTLTVEAKPTEPSEPTDPSASEPTEPSDASEPTKPDEPSQPSEPTIPGGSDDPSDNTDPSEQIGPAESEVIIPITGEEEPMPPWLLLFLALSITGTAWFHRKRKSEEKR